MFGAEPATEIRRLLISMSDRGQGKNFAFMNRRELWLIRVCCMMYKAHIALTFFIQRISLEPRKHETYEEAGAYGVLSTKYRH